ncbi:MAG: response regulator [Bacteroidia bacterium]|nr:response regulator [Bacteroidia bacterium]
MIKVIIVDDEQHAREYLRKVVEDRYPDLRVIALCRSIPDAEEAIAEFKPDLVLLDVELGKRSLEFRPAEENSTHQLWDYFYYSL